MVHPAEAANAMAEQRHGQRRRPGAPWPTSRRRGLPGCGAEATNAMAGDPNGAMGSLGTKDIMAECAVED
jgi:hypothetical protein